MSKHDMNNQTNEQVAVELKVKLNAEHGRVREVPDMEGVRELLEEDRELTEQEMAYVVKQVKTATEIRQELAVRLKELSELVKEKQS